MFTCLPLHNFAGSSWPDDVSRRGFESNIGSEQHSYYFSGTILLSNGFLLLLCKLFCCDIIFHSTIYSQIKTHWYFMHWWIWSAHLFGWTFSLERWVNLFVFSEHETCLWAVWSIICSNNTNLCQVPRKMLLQTYNLTHTLVKNGRDYEFYHR